MAAGSARLEHTPLPSFHFCGISLSYWVVGAFSGSIEMSYPFRIEAPSPIRANATGQDQAFSDYMDRLIRLVPAEILGLYLTIRGVWIPADDPGKQHVDVFERGFLTWWPVLCVVLLLVSRSWGTRAPNGAWSTVQLIPIAIAAVSFCIWVYAIGDPVLLGWRPDPKAAATAVVIWVFLVPIKYKGS
jgi:hypothetical protein